jgi:hypothetical protein
MLVALLRAVTFAPASTAPEGSVTRPVKLAVFTCAKTATGAANITTQKARERVFMEHLQEKLRNRGNSACGGG